MNVTQEQLAEVVSEAIGALRQNGREQRRAGRANWQGRVVIKPVANACGCGTKKEIRATLRDISPRGLCLLIPCAMTRGAQFIAQLPSRSGDTLQLLCNVMYAEQIPGGLYRVGGEFGGIAAPEAAADAPDEVERIRRSVLG